MKFNLKEAEPSQELILEALFGMFILPWLLVAGIVTLASIIQKISNYKDKKDPSRKLDRLSKWLHEGITTWMFVDGGADYDDYDYEDAEKKVDFSKTDRKFRIPVKNMPEYDDLMNKWKKWQACVTDISNISEMNDAGKQIQKIFAKYFSNKDLFTKKNNGVEYTGIRVIVRDTTYPDDKWFKPNVVGNAIIEIDKTGVALANALDKMSSKVKQCLEAPKTHKDDKEYLLGCLNYIATVDKVVDISQDIVAYIQDAGDACAEAYRKLTH